jgi:hypothetical protein
MRETWQRGQLDSSKRERDANGNLKLYAMDSYRASTKLTMTAGMRMT